MLCQENLRVIPIQGKFLKLESFIILQVVNICKQMEGIFH